MAATPLAPREGDTPHRYRPRTSLYVLTLVSLAAVFFSGPVAAMIFVKAAARVEEDLAAADPGLVLPSTRSRPDAISSR